MKTILYNMEKKAIQESEQEARYDEIDNVDYLTQSLAKRNR